MHASTLFRRLVLAAVLFTSAQAFARCDCQCEFSTSGCRPCRDFGRGYANLDGTCIVCPGGCNKTFAALSEAGDSNVAGASFVKMDQELLYLQVRPELITEIANVNPDAAHLLILLEVRGRESTFGVPTSGDGGSSKFQTALSVASFLNAKTQGKASEFESNETELRQPEVSDSWMRSTWELTKRTDTSAELLVKTRVMQGKDIELKALNPDVMLQLAWKKTGRSGYWIATNWTAQP